MSIDFLKLDGTIMQLRGTEVDEKGKQTWTEVGEASAQKDGRPFLWNSMKGLLYALYAPQGTDRTTAPESVTVPAGTFDTNKTAVRTKNVLGSYTIDAWVSPKLGLVKYDGTTVFTTAGTAQLTVELVSVQ